MAYALYDYDTSSEEENQRYEESEEGNRWSESEEDRWDESEEENTGYELITTRDVARCQQVVQEIMSSRKPVAVDSEGVGLSAKGRMTLLQICTWQGEVYLFDLVEPNDPHNTVYAETLMRDGMIGTLLTSPMNEKVFHACTNDSAALFHQFGIELRYSNVMDLQVANMALQRVQGKVFLRKKRLNELTGIYGTPTHGSKDEHESWMRSNYRRWEERPLTQRMIQYAIDDVTCLIPELYNILRSHLADAQAWPNYRVMVGWEIDQQIDSQRVSKERRESLHAAVRDLLTSIPTRHRPNTPLDRLSDEEKAALRMLEKNWGTLGQASSNTVDTLEERLLLQDIRELDGEWRQLRRLSDKDFNRLLALCRHQTDNVSVAAGTLHAKIVGGKSGRRRRRR